MKKILAAASCAMALLASGLSPAIAAGGVTVNMDRWPESRATDLAALQNGARLFANYCLNCHSANLMRWNRLRDIGLEESQIRDFLIFGNQKVGDMMTVAMAPRDGKNWFGKTPPDLSVITRARTSFDYKGTDYIYTLLRGYYRDASTINGWNNIAYPNIAMPHIMWERQGPREATIERVIHVEDEKSKKASYFREVSVFDTAGNATTTRTPLSGHPAESIEASFKPLNVSAARAYDADVADLVAYLAFMTDPTANTRVRIGVWVMLFLTLFTVFAWWLNREYWKGIK